MEKVPDQKRNNGPSSDSGTSRNGVSTYVSQHDLPDYLPAMGKNGPKMDSSEKVKCYKKEQFNKLFDDTASKKSREHDDNGEPPDGGWGWVITLGAFMISVIIDGVVYNFGLFFKELYVYYDESKSLTAWIGSTLPGFILVSGR